MATTDPTPVDKQTKPFADWLVQQRRGVAHSEASERLQELIESVELHEKKGTLTLKVEVRPSDEFGCVEIFDTLTVSLPAPKRVSSIFFVTEDHNLSREDPRQQRLGIHEVPPVGATGTEGND